MPDPTLDPTLQGTALRYAAGELSPSEATAFEARLADDQNARDALAEAIRLSAAALGQLPPTPHPVVRDVVRARVVQHPALPRAWIGASALACAVVISIVLISTDRDTPPDGVQAMPVPVNPEPRRLLPPEVPLPDDVAQSSHTDADDDSTDSRSVAEIWADLSTPEAVEKARDDELRWRQKVREMGLSSPNRPTMPGGVTAGD